MIAKDTICVWYDNAAEDAARAFAAMMTIGRIGIAAFDAVRRGES